MYNTKSIIPNSFTMTNMIIGFFAIILASRGNKEDIAIAGILVFIASFFDLFDGATARALRVESEIGGQLDSLADAVSYGIAPGFIAYQAYFSTFPVLGFGFNAGMFLAALFPLCATYRLARFNVDDDCATGFNGLPSPAAGIMVASIPALDICIFPGIGCIPGFVSLPVFMVIFIVTALLMVSKVDYNKLSSNIPKKGPTVTFITIIIITALLIVFKMWAVFIATALYISIGLLIYTVKYGIKKIKKINKIK